MALYWFSEIYLSPQAYMWLQNDVPAFEDMRTEKLFIFRAAVSML